MHFKGKVAIVTGGSSGIGKEAAKRLVAHGASVVLGGRDEEKLHAAAKEVSEDAFGQHVRPERELCAIRCERLQLGLKRVCRFDPPDVAGDVRP